MNQQKYSKLVQQHEKDSVLMFLVRHLAYLFLRRLVQKFYIIKYKRQLFRMQTSTNDNTDAAMIAKPGTKNVKAQQLLFIYSFPENACL